MQTAVCRTLAWTSSQPKTQHINGMKRRDVRMWWHPIKTTAELMRETRVPFSKWRTLDPKVSPRTLQRYRLTGVAVVKPPKRYAKKAKKSWPRVLLECFHAAYEQHTTIEAWERFWSRVNGEEA